uniref:Rap-GAP domain-containing protein n=1 Tax=Arcella intermedia TaxID=1963864 RepID=A0A6B2L133_9EUKA
MSSPLTTVPPRGASSLKQSNLKALEQEDLDSILLVVEDSTPELLENSQTISRKSEETEDNGPRSKSLPKNRRIFLNSHRVDNAVPLKKHSSLGIMTSPRSKSLDSKPLIREVDGYFVEKTTKSNENNHHALDIEEEFFPFLGTIYSEEFSKIDHYNFIGVDPQLGVTLVSLLVKEPEYSKVQSESNERKKLRKLESRKKNEGEDIEERRAKDFDTKAFLRNGTYETLIEYTMKVTKSGMPKAKDVLKHFKSIVPSISLIDFRLIVGPQIKYQIMNYEKLSQSNYFKFGIIYSKVGQNLESEMYSNNDPTPEFNEFLSSLGDEVILKGREGWAGGLDTQEDKDGTSILYTTVKNYEVVFHVSTMMKFVQDDEQQIQRKRHIGNDVVVIIYQQEDPNLSIENKKDDFPFSPAFISSKYNHVFIVVRRLSIESELRGTSVYRVGVIYKYGVKLFKPYLPKNQTFEVGPTFRDWLLHKCINGERSSFGAPAFAPSRQKAREGLLQTIFSTANAAFK